MSRREGSPYRQGNKRRKTAPSDEAKRRSGELRSAVEEFHVLDPDDDDDEGGKRGEKGGEEDKEENTIRSLVAATPLREYAGGNSLTSNRYLDTRDPRADVRVQTIFGPPEEKRGRSPLDFASVRIPGLEDVEGEEDRSILREIDADFSRLLDGGDAVAAVVPFLAASGADEPPNGKKRCASAGAEWNQMHKIYQKRLTNRSGHYVLGYGWKYHPRFYLRSSDVESFKRRHLNVSDVEFNVSGDCCSVESNAVVGIATPCYCDVCRYERAVAELEDLRRRTVGGGPKSAPAMPPVEAPRCPRGSWPRLLITVDKTPAANGKMDESKKNKTIDGRN